MAATYCLFAVVPATIAALRGGTERGDVHKDALAFAGIYDSHVAAYLAGAPRASKILELSALAVLPIVTYLLAVPPPKRRILLGDLQRAAVGTAVLILFGHSLVCLAMLVGHGVPIVAWSWMWRLAVLTLVSSAAELGLIVLALRYFGQRRRLVLVILGALSVAGITSRVERYCSVPALPACVDASLLSGRLDSQLGASLVATLWLALAVAVVARAPTPALEKARRDERPVLAPSPRTPSP